jgi:hypothetical protein
MWFAEVVLIATLRLIGPAIPAQDAAAPEAVLSTWFRHVERNELDSLRALLTSDFRFVSDGKRMGPDALVTMIKSLGIRSPRVQLRNIETHRRGEVAYLVYDRDETIDVSGTRHTIPETGSLVLVRAGARWLIAQWTATSPPAR